MSLPGFVDFRVSHVTAEARRDVSPTFSLASPATCCLHSDQTNERTAGLMIEGLILQSETLSFVVSQRHKRKEKTVSRLKSSQICLNSLFKATRVKAKCSINTGKRKQGRWSSQHKSCKCMQDEINEL